MVIHKGEQIIVICSVWYYCQTKMIQTKSILMLLLDH